MKKLFAVLFYLPLLTQGQMNNPFLIGYGNWAVRARMVFDSANYILTQESRQMGFVGTEATISDKNGNFLMSSNGIWIADSTGNIMMNGDSLNPSQMTASNPNGLLLPNANIILPYPDNATKYVLFHHTATWNGTYNPTYEVFYSVIDMTQNGGLGGVDSTQKNVIAFQDTLNWGLAACRHANGRDWWILAIKDSSDIAFKMLFTNNGLASVTSQKLNVPLAWGNVTQPTFSPDGTKFGYTTYVPYQPDSGFICVFDFDRCSGQFSNKRVAFVNTSSLWGFAFSNNSNLAYAASTLRVFQFNLNSLTVDTVAVYDGFYSPYTWCCATSFLDMYLAANGKIYITSGSSVQHIHEMNYPDSAGIACDLQQHAINLGVWSFRAVPNHPNYYLGCDTTQTTCPCLITGINDVKQHDFKFSISPNPSNGNFKITYLLPQNSKGIFEVFDITGKKVFSYSLPQWSTLQNFDLSFLSNGIYHCSIKSGNYYVQKKLAIIR